jgi:hypothetical protein
VVAAREGRTQRKEGGEMRVEEWREESVGSRTERREERNGNERGGERRRQESEDKKGKEEERMKE